MDLSIETQEKIQELQSIEQNLQIFIQQKQSMQVELNEISNALSELETTKDEEVYKILSGIMIKSSKTESIKELTEKQKILSSRVDAMEKQSDLLQKKSSELREELTKTMAEQVGKSKKKGKEE